MDVEQAIDYAKQDYERRRAAEARDVPTHCTVMWTLAHKVEALEYEKDEQAAEVQRLQHENKQLSAQSRQLLQSEEGLCKEVQRVLKQNSCLRDRLQELAGPPD